MDDKKLIERFLAGDEPSFNELVQKYLKPVYNFLFRLTNDQSAIDDLAQDTFLKAWKNIRRFDTQKSFKTWLFAIAKNTAYDYFKKKKAVPFSHFIDRFGNNRLEEIEETGSLPDEILDRENSKESLEKELKNLPAYYQLILLMAYKDDFSLHEIAEILEKPYNTIKSQHGRALNELKKNLKNK